MPTESPPSRPTAAPLGFTVGFVFLVVALGFVIAAAAVLGEFGDIDDFARWALLAQAVPLAAYTLFLAGALEMLRTTIGPARRAAQLAVAAIALILISTAVGNFLTIYFTTEIATDAVSELPDGLWSVAAWLATTGWHALTLAVVLSGWSVPRTRKLAPLAILCSLVAHPYAFAYGLVPIFKVILYVAWGGQLLLLWLVLRASIPEPEQFGGWLRAGHGIARLGKAMSLRVTFAFITVVFSVVYGAMTVSSTFDEETLEMVKPHFADPLHSLKLFAGPAGTALATALAISGALTAGSLSTFLAPRRRFYTAAALFTLIFSVRGIQLLVAYRLFPERSYFGAALPVLMPMLETAALALLVLGCRRLVEQLESAELLARVESTWLVLKVAQSFAVISPLFLVGTAGVEGMGTSAPGIAVLLASATPIVTMFSISRLCRAMAKEIELRGELPAAVVEH